MKQVLSLVVVLLAAVVLNATVRGDVVLYDVDFGTPPNTVGAPPVVGFGSLPRHTPTSQRSAMVDSPITGMVGPALSLVPNAASSSGVSFWLGGGADPRTGDPGLGVQFAAYEIEMDAVVLALLDSPLPGDSPEFKIEIEAPFPHQLRFTHDGAIRAITFDDGGISETRIGSFAFGQPFHLRLLAELSSHKWSLDLDGVRAFTGHFPNDGSLWSVNVALNRTSLIAAAGIDDVRITGLPEPTVGVLLMVGLWTLRRPLRLRPRRPGSAR